MPTVSEVVIEWRTIWSTLSQRQWERHYVLGSIGSGKTGFPLLEDFDDSLKGFTEYWDLYQSAKTISSLVRGLTFQVVWPTPGPILKLLRQTIGIQGRLICGTQPWHATYRANWHSSTSNFRPHWWQISPVPRFDQILSPDRAAYLRKLNEVCAWLTTPWSTPAGDSYRLALRQSDGTFHAVDSFTIGEFNGRQKTRRRVL